MKKNGTNKYLLLLGIIVILLMVGAYMFQMQQPKKAFIDISALSSELEYMLPESNSGNQIIHHLAYSLSYDEALEQAEWVAYQLTGKKARGTVKRHDWFEEDKAVKTGSASYEDYRGTGYDRGHLVPAGDMKWDQQAMVESFLMSNISPQVRSFNGGVWRILEEKIRDWAMRDDTLYIVTGSVEGDRLSTIGTNRVAVPEYFYKVVLDVVPPDYKAIGFIMRNKKSNASPMEFAVTIDEVEAFTGIDFFPALPDSLETILEAGKDLHKWNN